MRPVDYSKLKVRKCIKCKKLRKVKHFRKYMDASAPLNGWRYHSLCKDCNREQCSEYGKSNRQRRNERLRRWRKNNPGLAKLKDKRTAYKRKYGITLEELEAMSERQQRKCLICQNEKRLFVDHCHSSGTVRALLCPSCNSMIGKIESGKDILKRIVLYLQIPFNADILLKIANQ